jgi:hypothetical protein
MSLSALPLPESCTELDGQPSGAILEQALTHLLRGLLVRGIHPRLDLRQALTPLEQIEAIQDGLTLQPEIFVKPSKGKRPPTDTMISLIPNPASIEI